MRILISGASGLVGRALTTFLRDRGDHVDALRRSTHPEGAPSWDPSSGRLTLHSPCDAVVHLAGENVAGRWTADKKHRIFRSRVDGTSLLSERLADMTPQPQVMLCASATGYYGDRGEDWLTEESVPGKNFLAETAKAWEVAADPARAAGIRVAHLRLGIVLSPHGGALGKLLTPFRLGLGGRIGDGRQYWSWLAMDDLVRAVAHVLDKQVLSGPINLVAPHPVSNAEFARTLGAVLKRPAFLPMPAFAVDTFLGQMGREMLLASARVRPSRLVDSGFEFAYPELEGALGHLLYNGART